jgi:hypothetical protein
MAKVFVVMVEETILVTQHFSLIVALLPTVMAKRDVIH